jgi:hypothetical protein
VEYTLYMLVMAISYKAYTVSIMNTTFIRVYVWGLGILSGKDMLCDRCTVCVMGTDYDRSTLCQ